MRFSLPTSCFLFALLSGSLVKAQADHFAYVITDVNRDGANWRSLRVVDLQTGVFSNELLGGNDANLLSFDAATRKQMTAPLRDDRFGSIINAAFGTGVAAIALDQSNSRLYYTPMYVDQLRYIDLKTMRTYFVNQIGFTGIKEKAADQSNIVTRMVIASDGNGYALTNDGYHLVRFTTGKKPVVTDLGALIDDPSNENISIHNSCSSFGGDMIADDNNNLFLFSASNHVFRVNTTTRIAVHLGHINGMPAGFSTNGAAVDAGGKVLVSSATDNSALYVVDMTSLTAQAIASQAWRSSDLANSNLLQTRKSPIVTELIKDSKEIDDPRIRLFPNPAVDNRFMLETDLPAGEYLLSVTNATGLQITQSILNVQEKGESEIKAVQLPATSARGIYLVRINNANGKTVFSRKLLLP